jgi:peptidoglycan/xylan/chitin deacetylase (PgdA/CDA1 family)
MGIAATWAVVGALLARNREELRAFSPGARPGYLDPRLDPYREPVGPNETHDPLHFAPTLIQEIRQTPLQEIGTHTFSHYYCAEPGQNAAAFRADLSSALAIHAANGLPVRSIVFPRNQHNPAYDDILREFGLVAYRGTPRSGLWRSDRRTTPVVRAARLLDSYVPLTSDGTYSWEDIPAADGLANVRASRFLRPWSRALRTLEPLRVRRIVSSIAAAGERGRVFHLWWHPHNFGLNLEQNLGVLREILERFARLREDHGMMSLSMNQAARYALPSPQVREPECAYSM